ncbi:citrate synthase [Aurantimicrobium minutum]|nr:citrate synthase [Aurantimicrobium minutum]
MVSEVSNMNIDPQTKIGRPQQLYIGEQQRNLPGFN